MMGLDPIVEQQKALKKFKKTKEAGELVSWVKDQYTKCRQARTREVQQWNLNLAYYFGNQNVIVQNQGRDAGKLFTPAKQRNIERLIINRVRPMIRTELARMLSQKPAASVVPASSDDEDLMAAMAGEQVWESVYNRRHYHIHFSRAAFWIATTGTGFLKTFWDDETKDKDANTNGDIVYSSIQPYNLFVPDLLEQDIEDQPYVLEVTVKPVELVNMIYREVLDKPATSEAKAANSLLQDAYVNQRTENTAKPDSVYVYELWVKPGATKYLPQGGYVLIVGDEIVDYRPDGLPYGHEEFPYAKFEHIPTAKFYGASVIEDVINLQKEYNKIRSQIADNRRKMGNIQFAAHKGAIMPEKVTNEAGQFLIVRPGMQFPQQQQPAQLPAYISENLDRVLSDIEDISGQHQVSKGNVPPGITAATAISYLQERDDSLLTHTFQSIEHGTEKVAKQTLHLTVQFWDEPRLIRVVGADGAFDTNMLKGSDLVAGTDIRIEAGSALPQSKAAKQALIMDMMKFGWIDPQDGLKMMEIGGAQKIFEQLRSDERQAQRENIRLKNLTTEDILAHEQEWTAAQAEMAPQTTELQSGAPLDLPPVVTVNTYDNHAVHIEVHNRYRRGQAFEMLPDDVKAQFEVHVQHHKAMLQVEQMGMDPGMMSQDPTMEEEAPPTGGAEPPPQGGMEAMMGAEGGDM